MTDMRKRIAAIAVFACMFAACVFALAGCTASASNEKQIGNPENAASIVIANDTGKDIEAFYLKKTSAKKYGKALAQDGLVSDGAPIRLCYAADEKAAQDLKFTSNDGATYELHSLRLADIKDASLKISASGTSCYLEYTDATTGARKSILQSEQVAASAAADCAKADKELAKAKKEAAKAKKEAKEAKKAAAACTGATDAADASTDTTNAAATDITWSQDYTEPAATSAPAATSTPATKSEPAKSTPAPAKTTTPSTPKTDTGSGEDNRCIEL